MICNKLVAMLLCLPLFLGILPLDSDATALDWHTPQVCLPSALQESPWSEQLSAALDVARAAGRELLAVRTLNLAPLESASTRAGDLIFRMLHNRFPSYDYDLVYNIDGKSLDNRLAWIICPLDDFNAFINGLHTFSVQITLLHAKTSVIDICYYPALDYICFKVDGYGIFIQHGLNPVIHLPEIHPEVE